MSVTFYDREEAREYAVDKTKEGYIAKVNREGSLYKVKVLGFTGTQKGMTQEQKESVSHLVNSLEIEKAHHGDCIGADADFHRIAREKGIKLYGHPAKGIIGKRAYSEGFEEILEEKPPLTRNMDIVEKSDVIIATPKGNEEEIRSGTWATIRYAKKKGKKLYLVNPDGTVTEIN